MKLRKKTIKKNDNFLSQITASQLLALLSFYSATALISAYVAQYVFGHQPCILCLYQRLPFFAVVAVALVFLLFSKLKKLQKPALILCIALLFGNAVLAGYHVGVEQKIFAGPATCADVANLDEIEDIEELAAAIAKTKAVKCDTPSFVFLGLSMAAWNVIYCFFLAISTVVLLMKNKKKPK